MPDPSMDRREFLERLRTDRLDVVRKNAALLTSFRPLDPSAAAEPRDRLGPFFTGRNLPWIDPRYKDA
jgi:hypothetical protein